jgi:uncharacterized Zn-binding protein involved in type VI secretion
MPPAVRQLCDICTGHGSFPPRPTSGGSGNVFINNCGAHRVGDGYIPHGSPSPSPPHGASLSAGSPNVFVNSKAQGRIGDPVSCGSSTATGSGNVIVN